MECAGPGYSEKEQELHKSLIRDEEEELDSEVGGALTNGEFLQLIREENELYLPFVDWSFRKGTSSSLWSVDFEFCLFTSLRLKRR